MSKYVMIQSVVLLDCSWNFSENGSNPYNFTFCLCSVLIFHVTFHLLLPRTLFLSVCSEHPLELSHLGRVHWRPQLPDRILKLLLERSKLQFPHKHMLVSLMQLLKQVLDRVFVEAGWLCVKHRSADELSARLGTLELLLVFFFVAVFR